MNSLTKFQALLLGVFVFFIIVGVALFATYKNTNEADITLTLWGTLPSKTMRAFLGSEAAVNLGAITYVEKSPTQLEGDFLEAIATGRAPDFLLIPQDLFLELRNKLAVVPSQTLSERQYRDAFTQGTELFLSNGSTYGIPLGTDPLVMYWNRTLIQNAGFTKPPTLWQDFYLLTPKISQKDSNNNIIRSAVALGALSNVAHGKEILSALLLQSGTPIVGVEQGALYSALADRAADSPLVPAESALRFYTEFSDASSQYYSWNKALPNSMEMFLRGNLAVYFGFASELPTLSQRNPNLNFYVGTLPQVSGSNDRKTFGTTYAFVFPRSSPHFSQAVSRALALSAPATAAAFSSVSGISPARRDLLAVEPKDAYLSIFWNSSLLSESWLDPAPADSERIFSDLVSNITSGKESVEAAVGRASESLDALLQSLASR